VNSEVDRPECLVNPSNPNTKANERPIDSAAKMLQRGRERLVRQRTMLVNALRAHLAEFGGIAPQGLRYVGKLIAIIRR
jgi:transposase